MDILVTGIILIALLAVFWGAIKPILSKASNIALNSVAGLLILLVLNLVLGWNLPINLPTLVICGLFGIPGVTTLVILHLFGML